ncbi:MAG: penicillin-binding protein 1B [Idiomarina sp.]|nr:penicillin-binding protein 1B [Idiomarina sp.]
MTKASKPKRAKRSNKQQPSQRRRWLRAMFTLFGKLMLIGLVVLAFYAVYLDGKVRERFEANRYQAPALLYSRAMVLAPQEGLSYARVKAELQALNYNATATARGPGEYNEREDSILLHRRAFDFADGFEPSQRLRLRFTDGRLAEVVAWPSQQVLPQARLEPQLIGRFAADSGEDRLLVSLSQVPDLLQDTLLLIEDQDFYQHLGVKPSAIARAAVANLRAGRTVQGGSTLTQQLVKNMYLTHDQNLWRKANEAIMALSLDYRFEKEAILEAYFNEVYFGQDRGHAIHGVGLAAQYFFGKSVEDLSPAEIALLVGMVKGPSLYDPRRRPENAERRRELVLRLMFENDLISQVQYLAALEDPLVRRQSTRLVLGERPDYVDLVQRELRQLVPGREWQQTGLRVFTYYDPYVQQQAELAMTSRGGRVNVAELQGAMVIADYTQGVVRALVGNTAQTRAGFNRALDAKRPIGSLVKPFTFAIALETPQDYRLETMLDDSPLTLVNELGVEWSPRNFDGEFKGPLTLYQSFLESRNAPAVHLGMAIGPERVRARLYESGFDERTHAYPSLTLGSVDMSPLQVSQVYSTLLNQGVQQRLTSIEAVYTHWNQPLYQQQRQQQRVFSEAGAYLTNVAMQGVVREGTGRTIAQYVSTSGLGGKTGSTNELRDSWFVSYDQRYLVSVWLGQDDNSAMGLSGSAGALPVAGDFWQRFGVDPIQRQRPEGIKDGAFDKRTGQPVSFACAGEIYHLPTFEYTEPSRHYCDPTQDYPTEKEEDEEERSWFQRMFGRG